MSLPVFKTLGELRANLRDGLGFAAMGSQGGPNVNKLDQLLQLAQYQLYWMFDWRYLLRTFDQPTGVGQRFYALPSDLDPMQLQNMVTEEFDGVGVNHVVNGEFTHNLLGWIDASTGDGSTAFNSGGYLDVIDGTTGEGIIDQQLSGLDLLEEYTLGFNIIAQNGALSPIVSIGTTLGASDTFLSANGLGVGSHSFDFINDIAAPFLRVAHEGALSNGTVSIDNITVAKKGAGSKAGGIWPMTEGVDWQHDNYSSPNQRPLRYEIRDQLEVWPPSDRTTYTLRYEYVRKIGEFETDDDRATVDDTLVLLHALATGKGHYGQKDFNIVLAQANLLIQNMRAKNHGNRRYIRRNPEAHHYRNILDNDDYCGLVHRNILDV